MFYVIYEVYTNMYCEWPNGTQVFYHSSEEDAKADFNALCAEWSYIPADEEDQTTENTFVRAAGEIRITWGSFANYVPYKIVP